MKRVRYSVSIGRKGEDWHVTVPEVDGIEGVGPDRDAALRDVTERLASRLSAMHLAGAAMPARWDVEEAQLAACYDGRTPGFVDVAY